MPQKVFPANATTDWDIGSGQTEKESLLSLQISNLAGATTVQVQGRPHGSGGAFTALAWRNKTTDVVTTGATRIAANGLSEIDTSGMDVRINAIVAAGGSLTVDYAWTS